MAFKRSGVRLPLAPPNLLQKSPGSPGLFAFRTARPHFARKIVGSRRRSNRCPARPNRRATRGRDGAHCASRARTWASSPACSRGRPRFSVSSMRAFIHGRFDLTRGVDRARPVAVQDDRNLRPGRMAPGPCRVLGIGWAPLFKLPAAGMLERIRLDRRQRFSASVDRGADRRCSSCRIRSEVRAGPTRGPEPRRRRSQACRSRTEFARAFSRGETARQGVADKGGSLEAGHVRGCCRRADGRRARSSVERSREGASSPPA